jgi:hypothetical protein
MMNWKGYGKKRCWPNFKVLSRHLMELLRITTKNLSQDSRFPGRDLICNNYIYKYCNKFAGPISQWKFITLKAQYTTVDYN